MSVCFTYVQKCMQWRKWQKWRQTAKLWRFELDAKRGPLETGDFGKISGFGKINRHFCHFRQNCHFPKGHFANSFEILFTVWRFWRLSPFLPFLPNTPFSPKSPLSKGPLCHLIWNFVHSLAILAINRHFCRFRQCVHCLTYLITRLRTKFWTDELCNLFIQTTNRSTLFCSKTFAHPPVLAISV